jgi:hypothetical protein
MDEQIVSLSDEMLAELKKTNEQLNIITQNGSNYGFLDVCSKLDTIDASLGGIDLSIGMINI